MKSRELVRHFIDEVFNGRSLTRLEEYMREDYMQHSVEVADGREGFRRFCGGFFRLEPYMDVKQMFEADGNKAAVFFQCRFNNGHSAKVVDIYQIQDGKLAEHWDVVQPITGEDAVINGRGSF